MGFSENLQYLRKKHQLTQEQLAERLDVSRQSVSKWESGAAYPEIEKLLAMCEMFSCTMDELLRQDVQAIEESKQAVLAEEAARAEERFSAEENAKAYDRHMRWYARIIPLGVGVLILGLSLLLFLQGAGVSDTLATMAFLMVGLVGLTMLVVGGLRHDSFIKSHPEVDVLYPKEETERFEKRFIALIASGVACVLLAVIFMDGAKELPVPDGWSDDVYSSVFMLLIAVGVTLLIHAALSRSRYNVERYNRERAAENRKRPHKVDDMQGLVMLMATLAFFLVGFIGKRWGVAWVFFPVGGIICGILELVMDLVSGNWENSLSGVIMLTATMVFLLLGVFGNLWYISWVAFPIGVVLIGIVSYARKLLK